MIDEHLIMLASPTIVRDAPWESERKLCTSSAKLLNFISAAGIIDDDLYSEFVTACSIQKIVGESGRKLNDEDSLAMIYRR